MKYTQIPSDTFEKLQLNAGILVDSFNPATGEIGNLLGATTGGIEFSTNPEFTDFGEDIDNCPNNMMQLKQLASYDPQMSGTFLTCTAAIAKMLVGAADVSQADSTRVIPRKDLLTTDFDEVWWIGDYSNVNNGSDAGFIAVRLMNALNQAGIQITSSKNEKGQFAFEFHGHYDMESQDVVPFEIYVKQGESEGETPSILLNKHSLTLEEGEDYVFVVDVVPSDATISWSSSATGKASVSDGTVHGEAEGSAIITASITEEGVTYNDTCTVVVVASA